MLRQSRAATALAKCALLVTLAAGCTKSAPGPAPAPPKASLPVADLQTAFNKTSSQYDVPGAVAGVWVDGAEPWTTTSGGLTTDDRFPIRSVTKSFTVTLILQLVREGKISLDDPISKYVKGVPNGGEITLAELAGMTAGLVDYSQVPKFQKQLVADFGRQWTPSELIDYGIAQKPLFAPGTRFGYSNTNTLLLGKVVETITGKSLADVYQEQILDPLLLDHTTYPDDANIPNPHGTPYQLNPDSGTFEELPVLNLSSLGAAGGLVSTLDDLHLWGRALGSGELIGSDLQNEREAAAMPADHPKYDNYALGIGQLDGWWGHTGEGLGYQAAVFRRPADGAVIVVLLNSTQDTNVATEIFQSLAATLTSASTSP